MLKTSLHPQKVLIGFLILVTTQVSISLWMVHNTPWTGLDLSWQSGATVVSKVHPESPNADNIMPGDTLTGLRITDTLIPFDEQTLILSPDIYPTFEQYNQFLNHQSQLFNATLNPDSVLLLKDAAVPLTTLPHRPIKTIPFSFWVSNLVGATGLLCGFLFWLFNRRNIITRWLCFNGFWFWGISATYSITNSRELLMSAEMIENVMLINHLSQLLYSFSLLTIFWLFPKKLGKSNAPMLLLSPAILIWCNEYFQWTNLPVHSFFIYMPVVYSVGVLFITLQWRRTRQSPTERASLKWLVLSIMLSVTVTLSLTFIPMLLGYEPLTPDWVSHGSALFMYLGLMLGVARYRLFAVERWWLATLTWFLSGLAVVLLDLLLIYGYGMNQWDSMGVSLIVIGWVYFPLRQLVINYLMKDNKFSIQRLYPQLTKNWLSQPDRSSEIKWQEFLQQLYSPLQLDVMNGPPTLHTRVSDNGAIILVPSLKADKSIRLKGKLEGRNLFNHHDIMLCDSLYKISSILNSAEKEQQKGAQQERQRIAMDLHDDVAPLLLQVIHQSANRSTQATARDALKALRESIYSLSQTEKLPVTALFEALKKEIDEQVLGLNVKTAYEHMSDDDNLLISNFLLLTMRRVTRESIVNAIKHARPTMLEINAVNIGGRLYLSIIHDGDIPPVNEWKLGRGVLNVKKRLREHKGQCSWRMNKDKLVFECSVALIPPE